MLKGLGRNLVVILLVITALLLTCLNYNQQVVTQSALREPAYHLMPARAEFVRIFYETPEKVGFKVLDGIFLYNVQEDRFEADFALSEGCFPEGYLAFPYMARDEKSIIIGGMEPGNARISEHYYRYDIESKKMARIDGDMTKVAMFLFPNEDRQVGAFEANSWNVEELRYYPIGSEEALAPFKVEEIPTIRYIMQDKNQDSPFTPVLTLMEDGRFQFLYAMLSSYLNYGEYRITGNEYKMMTKDGQYTYIFYKKEEDLVFDAQRSSRCILDDKTELRHGTVFSIKEGIKEIRQ